jgi:hypothetical protein
MKVKGGDILICKSKDCTVELTVIASDLFPTPPTSSILLVSVQSD